MVSVRSLNSEELKDAIQLTDRVFRNPDQPSMGPAFPNMFSSHLSGQSYGAFEDGKLVSFLGLVPTIIQVGPSRLKTYSLGSVCTHPDFRGKGYASEILKKVIMHVDNAGASLLLVSGSRSLYRRVGCQPFGDAQRFSLDFSSAQSTLDNHSLSGVGFRELKPTDWLELIELSRSRLAHFEQSVWDLSVLIEAEAFASVNHHHHKVLVAEEENHIVGFLVLGVPYVEKERPVVYEYAGSHKVVASLMGYAVKNYCLDSLDIPVPRYDESVIQTLSFLPSKKERNFGTVKVIRAERLIEQLRPYFQMKKTELNERLEIGLVEKGHVELTIGEATMFLNNHEFVSLIFDMELGQDLNHQSMHSLRQLFPIPFPYTGGLNYV